MIYFLFLHVNLKIEIMQTITLQEFNDNQSFYIHRAVNGEQMQITLEDKVFKIAPVDEGLSADELESVRRGLEDVKAGRTYGMLPNETLSQFVERMEREGDV